MLNFNIEARITIRFRSDHQKRYRLEFKPFTFDSAKILQNYASERLFNVQRTHPRFIAIHRGKRTVKMLCTTIDDDKIYNLTVAVMQPHKHTSQECKIDCFYSLWHVHFQPTSITRYRSMCKKLESLTKTLSLKCQELKPWNQL